MENTLATGNSSPQDQRRVDALKRYRILGTPPEQTFDNIARLATQMFDLPVALISFIDTENVFLKSNLGVEEIRNSPRSNSICAMALGTEEVTVVENIPAMDQHLLTDPLLVAEMGFKFYAGAPLITYDGFTIGTICVIGREIRSFTEKETAMLKGLARIVMDEIELRLRGIFDAEDKVLDLARIAQLNFNNQSLIANAPMAIGVLHGRQLLIELANPIILEVWGKTDAVIGQPLEQVLPELRSQGFLKILDDVFTSGNPFFGKEVSVFLERNGKMEDVFFNFVYQPLKDREGNTTSIMVVANEITEEIKARNLLQQMGGEKQATNDLLLSTIRNLTAVSPGMSSAQVDLTSTRELIQNMLNSFPDNQSGLRQSLLKIEESLRKAEHTFRASVEHISIGVWHVNVETMECITSPGLRKLFGYPAGSEITCMDAIERIQEGYGEKMREAVRNAIEQKQSFSFDFPLDGSRTQPLRWLRAFGKLDYTDGKATHLSGVTMEIPDPQTI